MECRNCGDLVDPRRVELGYDYCLKDECQQRCLQRVELAAVGVNKAADYYMRADEALPPPAPAAPPAGPEPSPAPTEVDAPGSNRLAHRPASTPPKPANPPKPPSTPKRARSTLDRLREQEAQLDEALDGAYERFRLGEITAREMDRERDRLVEAFNRQVRSANIRYRSLLRPSPHGGGGRARS